MHTRPELLAPAGDRATAKIAFRFGADAVYVGGPMLQLRAGSAGFPMEEIALLAREAHELDKKVYVTVNAFAFDDELPRLTSYARELRAAGADAAIIADPGVMAVFREAAPELPIHVSTQTNCTNAAAARLYYALGARRIVPARELSLAQLKEFRRNLPEDMEVEAFVHGAMCMAYSGRCMISAFLTGRSANRGACTQPCRWNYALVEEKRPGMAFPVEETESGMALLSSYDLCCLPFLHELENAGVASYKIEGRMKSEYYVATVVGAYRRRIDGCADGDALMRELKSVSHRPYSSGFAYGELKHMPGDGGGYAQDCVYVAIVVSASGGRAVIELKNKIYEGDLLEALSPEILGLAFTARNMRDAEGAPVGVAARPSERYEIDCPDRLQAGDLIRRRTPA